MLSEVSKGKAPDLTEARFAANYEKMLHFKKLKKKWGRIDKNCQILNNGYTVHDFVGVPTNGRRSYKNAYLHEPIWPLSKIYIEFEVKRGLRIKLGVSKQKIFDAGSFSDTEIGWSFYLAQVATRYGSNTTGKVLFKLS